MNRPCSSDDAGSPSVLGYRRGRDLAARGDLNGLMLSARAAVSRDGRVLWGASHSHFHVRVDVRRGTASSEMLGPRSFIHQVAHLPWCEVVAVVVDGAISLRDERTMKPLTARGVGPGALWDLVAVASSAGRLALEPATEPAARSGRAEVWEVARAADDPAVATWRRVAALPFGGPLRLSLDGSTLAGSPSEGRICAYDILRGSKRWEVACGLREGEAWALTPDGSGLLAVKPEQSRLHLYRIDGATGYPRWRQPVPENFAGMTVSPDGAGVVRLLGASIDWREVTEGILVRSVPVAAPPGAAFQWFPAQSEASDAPLIMSQGSALYEVCPKRGEVRLPRLPPITFLAVAPDGKRLAGVDAEGCVAIWPITEARPVSLAELGGPPVALAWSSDGKRVAAASARGVLCVDAERKRTVATSLDELEFPAGVVAREVTFAAGDRAIVVRVSSAEGDAVCALASQSLELRWHENLPPATSTLTLDTGATAVQVSSSGERWRDVWTGLDRDGHLQARAGTSSTGDVAVPGAPGFTLRRGDDGRWRANDEPSPWPAQEAEGFLAVASCPRGDRIFAATARCVVTFERGSAPEAPRGVAPPPAARAQAPATPRAPPNYRPRQLKPVPTLEKVAIDLTAAASQGGFSEVVGRAEEIQRVIEVLCRRTKRNPVLLGPAGVGKTAIVEGLAARIARDEVPPFLHGARLFSIQPQALASAFERVVAEASQDGILLFIDEVHAIVGAGGAEGRNDVATQFKPALSRGALAVIAATTDDEYRRFIEADGALERRFAPVRVHALSPAATLEVLRALRKVLERLRGVVVGDEVLEGLVVLAQRHMRNRHFPDKAVDLLEQCVAVAVATGRRGVSLADAVDVVQRFVDVPLDIEARLPELVRRVRANALLEDKALDQLHARLQVTTRGVDARPERPNAVLLLSGSAAASAHALSEELAATLFGSAERVIDIDCGPFVHPSDVNRLLGAPPAYIGHGANLPLHRLAQAPWCVLLLRNVHACHPQILEVITAALAGGAFTDSRGRSLPVSDAIVVLTARARRGASRRPMGFDVDLDDRGDDDDGDDGDASLREMSDGLADLCDVVASDAATRGEASAASGDAMLTEAARRYAEHGLELRWDPAVTGHMLDGARGLDRASLERFMDRRVAPLLLPWIPAPGGPARCVVLRVEAGALVVTEG